MKNKLDHPVWYSLHETHAEFCLRYPGVIFYQPDYCPFGAVESNADITESMDQYSLLTDEFFIVGEKPNYNGKLRLKKELVCLQMVIDQLISVDYSHDIIQLNEKFEKELTDIVNLVQPGYFRSNTSLLGNYYGIFLEGNLISVTGERMQMDEFTEVSAVVTDPEHTGKGYAKQLIAHTVNEILGSGKTAFLHVAETNTTAIRLYEKLGFNTRRKISFWQFGRH